ncbi:Rho guanyl nucleotide exchange factor protein [Lasiodiplodia theobromae]|nr:Rho guanyl nucleotide exchange factor protein [Lasiodiplodia theobromae]KAF4542504.1 Rho guanyl nucleotide exchange factor protein [Lasiodiplodia theobromae]
MRLDRLPYDMPQRMDPRGIPPPPDFGSKFLPQGFSGGDSGLLPPRQPYVWNALVPQGPPSYELQAPYPVVTGYAPRGYGHAPSAEPPGLWEPYPPAPDYVARGYAHMPDPERFGFQEEYPEAPSYNTNAYPAVSVAAPFQLLPTPISAPGRYIAPGFMPAVENGGFPGQIGTRAGFQEAKGEEDITLGDSELREFMAKSNARLAAIEARQGADPAVKVGNPASTEHVLKSGSSTNKTAPKIGASSSRITKNARYNAAKARKKRKRLTKRQKNGLQTDILDLLD